MGEISCPNCGNPNLDVDAQNNVVYCKNCGFAVQVDPQSGNVTPINPGQGASPTGAAPGGGGLPMPSAGGGMGHKTILGMEPFVFLSIGVLVALLAGLVLNFQMVNVLIIIALVFLAYWFFRR